MNTAKIDFLTDRAAVLGEKLSAKLQAGKIPGADEMAFFASAIAQLAKVAPAHQLRVLAMELQAAVEAAKAKRAAWLAGRDEALKAAEARVKAKQAARAAEAAAEAARVRAARRPSNKVARELVAEFKSRAVPVAAPKEGTATKQGLSFIVELPLEWQNDDKVIA
jgi:hypothetical protein